MNTVRRSCRECGTGLPTTRYFKCYDCQPELSSLDDDYIYHGLDSEGIMDDMDLGDIEELFEEDIIQLAKITPRENDD